MQIPPPASDLTAGARGGAGPDSAPRDSNINAERHGINSDHFFVRYEVNPNCGNAQMPRRRSVEDDLGSRTVEDDQSRRTPPNVGRSTEDNGCNTPVPGMDHNFVSRHLDNAAIATQDSAPTPTLKKKSSDIADDIQVRFSTEPGQYLLVFGDEGEETCITRMADRRNVTEVPCGADFPELANSRWKFQGGQIVTPNLDGTLQPSPNELGAPLITDTEFYQWEHKILGWGG